MSTPAARLFRAALTGVPLLLFTACVDQFTSKTPLNRSATDLNQGSDSREGVIPTINVPSTGGGSPGSGMGTSSSLNSLETGIVKSLSAAEFPINKDRNELSGTIAKLSLNFPRSKVGGANALVRVRRWGPFSNRINKQDFTMANAAKFKCPTEVNQAENELTFESLGPTANGSDYAQKFMVRDLHPLSAATTNYFPIPVVHFEDKSGLPFINIPDDFAYDGDRNLNGISDIQGRALSGAEPNPTVRRETALVPDTYYVYVFCVGKIVANKYEWALEQPKLFIPLDLEPPKAFAAPVVSPTKTLCLDQNNSRERRGEIDVSVSIAQGNGQKGGDRSIGLAPNMSGIYAANDVIEVRYITKSLNNPVVFKDDPLGGKLSDSNYETAYYRALLSDLVVNNRPTVTPDQALTALRTSGEATLRFLTLQHFTDANLIGIALPNTLVKDYLGGSIPISAETPQVKIAYEILLKDNSRANNSIFSNAVFAQPFSAQFFEGLVTQPRGVFFRGETPAFYNLDGSNAQNRCLN